MKDMVFALAAAIIVAAVSALGGYGLGDRHGAARVQQQWDHAATQVAEAKTEQVTTTRGKEADHASHIIAAIDTYQATQSPAAADSAVRIADAQRLQRAAEDRALRYRALSQASEAERDRLAGDAARLDASLAEGRVVAEQLRATVVERDNQIRLLADTIRADRILCGAADTEAEP